MHQNLKRKWLFCLKFWRKLVKNSTFQLKNWGFFRYISSYFHESKRFFSWIWKALFPWLTARTKKLENCGTLSDIGQFRKKLQNFWKKMGKSQKNLKWWSENFGKFGEKSEHFEKNWRISGKMGKFEGKSQKNFKWWWENLGKFEEKLENFDTNWKTSEKDSIPFHSVPFRSIPFHSVPFRSIPVHSVPFQSNTDY